MGKTSSKVKARWNAKAYDRIEMKVPKGNKALVEHAASNADMSVNAYTTRALLDKMGLSEWPTREGKDDA